MYIAPLFCGNAQGNNPKCIVLCAAQSAISAMSIMLGMTK